MAKQSSSTIEFQLKAVRMECCAILPARGGSKGIPGKNALLLAGKPLIAHAIEQARLARSVPRIVVPPDVPAIAALVDCVVRGQAERAS